MSAIVPSIDTVAEIAESVGLGKAQSVSRLTGGKVNHVFLVQSKTARKVLRLNTACREVFAKEKWAMEQARQAGVTVPEVFALGQCLGYDYMLLSFEEGEPLSSFTGDKERAIFALGRQASLINSVAVEGYGYHLVLGARPRFSATWKEAVTGELLMTFEHSACVKTGALSEAENQKCRVFLEAILDFDFPARLCHCDLNEHNVLVQDGGRLVILDWTQAKGGAAPLFDLARHSIKEPSWFDAICEGYGLSPSQRLAYATNFHRIALADKMRALAWAFSNEHPRLCEFIADVRSVYSQVDLG